METNAVVKRHMFTYAKDNLIRDGDIAVIYEGIESAKQIVMLKG